ncbi:MAG: type-F conjugative transfer system protein TraW [Zoogloeaceae bacterium]|uniref:Conjugal transfer protein TraW n=3 Tax=Alphaproteobacteria TaxID=28211 RepID=A0A0G3XL33_9SPHN|nr:conjugal transfer protein TraW [Novosphingobium pentaromativorans US6-1]AKM12205.1 conjugal transfer protein TraW [Croceicoccus naphthovorans]EHJ58092.1 sex pilus assembly and synthesis protein [Novosphingobium pentaromativorans US6-1]MCP5233698.1 type-F conjugative transfer system protein TraW [Zoogloeaceae bacterium]
MGLGLAAGWPAASMLQAADHGQMGQTFPIIEEDLLATIEARLRTLEASGQIEDLQRRMQQQATMSVRRPKPVAGLSAASERRQWLFDPSIVLEADIRDAENNLIATRGTRVNPLDHVSLGQDLVFIDGTVPAQIDWAVREHSAQTAKIIFVAGSPFDMMKPHQRRFWFDQGGRLTTRFGIRHTPAVVTSAGKALRITEVPLGGKGGAT